MTHPVRRALISVSDKTGLEVFAHFLHQNGVEIISTGGTADFLTAHKIPVVEVSAYTGFPEILSGRVKTLHPKIHASLLRRKNLDEETLKIHEIAEIDLLVVNFYPFEKLAADAQDLTQLIEQIDIGGPTMVRAAAKNYQTLNVLTHPNQYKPFIELYSQATGTTLEARLNWAKAAFNRVAQYDAVIANTLSAFTSETSRTQMPESLSLHFESSQELRYGENPHQAAKVYCQQSPHYPTALHAELKQGKTLSYNNLLDADAALTTVQRFPNQTPTTVIVKHNAPCGAALGQSVLESYQKAFESDPESAFGGIIACNQCLDKTVASQILNNQFVEVIIAPEFTLDALALFQAKPNIRVLATGYWPEDMPPTFTHHAISGGLLWQEKDNAMEPKWTTVTERAPTSTELHDLMFANTLAAAVKSNAIVLAKNGQSIGIGGGQTSRVSSLKIALSKAEQFGFSCTGAVLASDGFFPFPDSIEMAAKAGITAIVQPGGSQKDMLVFQTANEYNLAMQVTGFRHFKH